MSHEPATKIELGLEELGIIREQFTPLTSTPPHATVSPIETAAACAMLHSFYTINDPQSFRPLSSRY